MSYLKLRNSLCLNGSSGWIRPDKVFIYSTLHLKSYTASASYSTADTCFRELFVHSFIHSYYGMIALTLPNRSPPLGTIAYFQLYQTGT